MVVVIRGGTCGGATVRVSAGCTVRYCTWKPLLSSLPMSLSFSAALILSTDSLRMFLTATLPSCWRDGSGRVRGRVRRGDSKEVEYGRTDNVRREGRRETESESESDIQKMRA